MTNIELALAVNRTSKIPQSMLNGQGSIKNYKDGEIIHKPLGFVFVGKNEKNHITKFLFQVCDMDRYTKSQHMSVLIRLNNCKRNTRVFLYRDSPSTATGREDSNDIDLTLLTKGEIVRFEVYSEVSEYS